jgi:hypothetical protein
MHLHDFARRPRQPLDNTMYRCIALSTLTLAAFASAAPAIAFAQGQPTRSFPQNALRGVVVFGEPPEVVLNGQPARLAPAARLRNQNNLLVLSGTLVGDKWTVFYTQDISGLIKELWILRDDEMARKPWPVSREQAQQWTFDIGNQVWTAP